MYVRTVRSFLIPLPRVSRGVVVGYAYFLFAAALVFGGGTRQDALGDVLLELLALPLLAGGGVMLRSSRLPKQGKIIIGLAAAPVLLLLFQMVPLPPSIWSNLPGRASFTSMYQMIGLQVPWLPISLDPTATWRALLSLLPGLSLLIASVQMTASERERLLSPLVPLGVLSALLTALQMMGGSDSSLRFYDVTNIDRGVGFFANANHNAAFLYCVLPLATALLARRIPSGRDRAVIIGVAALVCFAVFIGLALSHSRAGLALGLLSLVLSTIIAYCAAMPKWRIQVLRGGIAAAALALLLSFQFGFVSLSNRMEDHDLVQDLRWPVAAVTFGAAAEYMPIGSGIGTFQPVYEMHAPRTMALPVYINHAHNDWLELGLEAGIPGAVLAAFFLTWFLVRSGRVWGNSQDRENIGGIALARAGAIVILLLLLHSIVDYPLRTIAIQSILAVSCGLLSTAIQRV